MRNPNLCCNWQTSQRSIDTREGSWREQERVTNYNEVKIQRYGMRNPNFVAIDDHHNDPFIQERAAGDKRIHGSGTRKPDLKKEKYQSAKQGCPILDTVYFDSSLAEGAWSRRPGGKRKW